MSKSWQDSWNTEINNKLHIVQPLIKPPVFNRVPRRDEILIHRLRVGHTYLTHSYLLHKESPPECDFCHLPLTVEHILISCSEHVAVRKNYFIAVSLKELFEKVTPRIIVDYIKEIGLYRKL